MRPPRVIISGGGTGGHIFPAIAIANAVKKQSPQAEILFVGAKGRMEMEKVPQAGYEIKGLWISGFQRRLTLKNLLFPFKLVHSMWKAGAVLRKFKPDVAVGVGGYASGPLLKRAVAAGIPAIIQEQNSYAGVTNKLLGKDVDHVCVAFEGMEKFFPKDKIVLTGNPIRKEVIKIEGKKEEAAAYFGVGTEKPTLLIIGGSLGARSLNEAMKANLKQLSETFNIVWQCGKLYFEEMKGLGTDSIKVLDFIGKMDLAYSLADVIVSRAGAISVSELCLIGKPAILVPSPNVAEDHQTKNAMALVNKDAALLIKDVEVKDQLGEVAVKLYQDKGRCDQLSENIRKLGIANADEVIAEYVLKLANKN